MGGGSYIIYRGWNGDSGLQIEFYNTNNTDRVFYY